MTFPLRRWDVAPRVSDECLAEYPEYDPLVIQLLHNRNVLGPAEIHGFLSRDDISLADPFLFKDMDVAVERITRAVAQGELIAVYGDFDVDGVTGAVLLTEVLEALGARVMPYIPHRLEEGYGLNCSALASLRERGASLIISVDCGAGAGPEICFGKGIGLDVVVVDHHQIELEATPALAVVDPRRQDCPYPFKSFAAVGVAFRVAQALLGRCWLPGDPRISQIEEQLLDLVALGTVADVVPLIGENRHLVRRGLVALNRTRRVGLKAMLAMAGLKLGAIGTGSIGYIIGPRLNAAGRLHNAAASYRLLTTKDNSEACDLAQYLEETNQERQKLTEEALRQARDEILLKEDLPKLLMISGENFQAGIVGLVAGRLVEEFYRPTVVVELGDEVSRGSARSIAELDITHALGHCGDLLTRFGGHSRAAGFAVPSENVEELERRLQAVVEEELDGVELHPRLGIDCELPSELVCWDTYRLVEIMAPFGFGNPMPIFLTRNLWVADSRGVGRESPHLKLKLTDGRRTFGAIAFGLGRYAGEFVRKRVDVVYQMESNEWNGSVSLQMVVRDLRIANDSP